MEISEFLFFNSKGDEIFKDIAFTNAISESWILNILKIQMNNPKTLKDIPFPYQEPEITVSSISPWTIGTNLKSYGFD